MTKLYIVGNGFDRAHNLKTSYWDFRTYLSKYASDFLIALERMYRFAPIDSTHCRTETAYRKLQKRRKDALYNKLWRSFESDLGQVDESEMLDFSQSIVDDLYLESGPIGIEDTLNDYWEEQYSFISTLQDYVYRWARQIRLNKAVVKKQSIYSNATDFFLTFNYTNVLERIYKIPSKNILHIHGGLAPYCNEKPILGHGNLSVIESYREQAKEADNEFDEASKSICNAIANYYERTLKNTWQCQLRHFNFFAQLSTVDVVEIIGHSLGAVDIVYFQTIKRSISSDAHWNIYYLNPDDKAIFEQVISDLGVDPDHIHALPSSDFWD